MLRLKLRISLGDRRNEDLPNPLGAILEGVGGCVRVLGLGMIARLYPPLFSASCSFTIALPSFLLLVMIPDVSQTPAGRRGATAVTGRRLGKSDFRFSPFDPDAPPLSQSHKSPLRLLAMEIRRVASRRSPSSSFCFHHIYTGVD